jgi:hypothetical protein
MESFGRLPAAAAWRHETSRDGFEVVHFEARDDGTAITGQCALVVEGVPLGVRYAIELDPAWRTRRAHVRARTPAGEHETLLETDGAGCWSVDGAAAPRLDGILDVDLEASAMTNAFPVRRMRLERGVATAAPAAWVRAHDLSVERLEQTYTRRGARAFDYAAVELDFRVRLSYDDAGLVEMYPEIARRVL